MYRVVNDMLDPALYHPVYFDVLDYVDVKNWCQEISDIGFCFYPQEFYQFPYFFEDLNEVKSPDFIEISNFYMNHIMNLMGKKQVVERLYQNYIHARDNNTAFPYWQKQWLKHRFKVEKAIELRAFNKDSWNKILIN